MSYPNLKAEMARKNITQSDIATKTGISLASLNMKLNGKTDFSINLATKIKDIIGTDMPIEILFREE